MLRDYVTKRLPFFQGAGRRAKTPEEEPGPVQEAVETPAAAPDSAGEEDLSLLFCGPSQEEAAEAEAPAAAAEVEPGLADYEAGMAAWGRGERQEAQEALLRAARAGHAGAQFRYGRLCQEEIAPGGLKEALAWYKRAAKGGLIDAQLACAVMFEEGLGTEMNLERALGWYELAARQGSVGAQLKCGRLYAGSRAGIRNPKKARRWLEAAAEGGSEEARRLLRERF